MLESQFIKASTQPDDLGPILEPVGLPASGYNTDLCQNQDENQDSLIASIAIKQEQQKILDAVGLGDSDKEGDKQQTDKVIVTEENTVDLLMDPIVNVGATPRTQFSQPSPDYDKLPNGNVISACHGPIKDGIDLSVLRDIPIPPTITNPLQL